MTERVPRAQGGVDVSSTRLPDVGMPHANVTPDVVDRAVEETFREAGVSPNVARVMRSLMAGDTSSPVAKAYYHGVASGRGGLSSLGVSRRVLEVPYVVGDSVAAQLSEYALDFQLRFSGRESHDHPAAAACRTVDRAVVDAKLPPGVPVSHIGGAVLPLVLAGKLGEGHHACVPDVDKKDPARHVLLRLRMRKLAASQSVDARVRRAAAGYLAHDPSHMCNKLVQECDYKTPVLTSVHVYDIPMDSWASILDRKGGQLVEGCILFPRDVFSRSSGEMQVAGARYELDARANTFRMGFVSSPSWWYEHSLSDYLKYGVDQVLSAGKAVYSYKVVERRGDTIFFRILRIAATALPTYVQHYAVPGVPMVRVNGFPVDKPRGNPLKWARRAYLFPAPLWEDMLGFAKECVERGVLTPEKLFGYYRTVAPRQSINAVVVAGGATVDDLNHLVPLVVHVSLFAMLEVAKTKTETAHITASVMKERLRQEEFTVYKIVAAFGQLLLSTVKLTCAPLEILIKCVDMGIGAIAALSTYDWELQPVVQQVSAKLILPSCFSRDNSVVSDFSQDFSRAAPRDLFASVKANPRLAAFALGNFSSVIPSDLRESLTKAATPKEDAKEVEPVSSVPAETERGTVFTIEVSKEEVGRRQASIREAILESSAEAKKTEAACADHFRELLTGGKPNSAKIVARKEAFFNPEFWKVVGGVIESSFSGLPVNGFQHAVVYVPSPVAGSRLVPVHEEEYRGMSQGEYVERTHYKLVDSDFSGWVYTNDSLMIHNGPAIEKALEAALGLPLDFHVTLRQAPPGSGKTTAIVNTAQPDDAVLVPVRKAAEDTRKRLKSSRDFSPEVLALRVRTLDSYLVNRDRTKSLKKLRVGRLLADEAFMAREGRWLAAAALLGCDMVEAFGDKWQIPHVPRAECPKTWVSLVSQRTEETHVSYRCPPQSVACWGSVYEWKTRSASKVEGIVKHVSSSVGLEIPSGCVMMGMYQADKKILQQKYGNCGVKIQIMTVHESEGNTYKHVWLHRFDLRKRTDSFSLYDKEPYALVAMSRNTHSFVYVAPDLGDVVSAWIKRGADPRRVAAAADLASAGSSVEKL